MAAAEVCTPAKGRTHYIRNTSRKPMSPSPQAANRRAPAPARSDVSPSPAKAVTKLRPSDNLYSRPFSASTAGSGAGSGPAMSGTASGAPAVLKRATKPAGSSAQTSPRKAEAGSSDWLLGATSSLASGSTLSGRKSVSSSPNKANVARPSRGNKTTMRIPYNAVDRFIPNRSATEITAAKLEWAPSRASNSSSLLPGASDAFGHSHHDDLVLSLDSLALGDDDGAAEEPDRSGPESAQSDGRFESSLASACGVKLNTRILAFKPAAPESSKPIDLRLQYNQTGKSGRPGPGSQRRRAIPPPDRILDAPNIVDDYYLNLLDWSCNNQVVIGLNQSVYVWSADTGDVSLLLTSADDTYVSSVRWSDDGAFVSVGLASGEVQIWDVEAESKIRSMFGHETRVSSQSWTKHILSTGARNGWLFNHDVRIAQHHVATMDGHASEVCGLEWRADGAQLASGGNDNLVAIWDARALQAPKFAKTNHTAAVKALAWCPWQTNLLATGGGSADRHIHFWNTTSGARVNSIDTGSQVTSVRWSSVSGYKEIASTSGYPDNSISLWSYPSLVRMAETSAHDSRILHSCISPDGQTIATAAADETLKFWKVFEKKKGSSGPIASGPAKSVAGLGPGLLR